MLQHRDYQTNAYALRLYAFDRKPTRIDQAEPPPASVAPLTCWQVWQQQHKQCYRLCLRWLNGNQADADDAFNTAALAVWRTANTQAQVIENPMGWIRGLLHHICMDIHRARQKHTSHVAEIDATDEEVGTPMQPGVLFGRSPETIILQREKCTYVHAAINALPTRLRTPLVLRFYQDQSYEEIANQLGLSADNVRKRIQEARAILDRKLHAYQTGDAGLDLHMPWPDEHTLFVASIPASPADDADEATTIQPRVIMLTQVSKREEQKLRTLRAYVASYPSGWKKRLELADQLCKMGYQMEAVAAYEQVLEKQPRLISVWLQLGRIYQALQRGQAAVAAYERALLLATTAAMQGAIGALLENVGAIDCK